jgi:hypothetical protein
MAKKEVDEKEIADKAYKLLSKGKTLVHVAADLGICKDTLFEWLKPKNKNYKPLLADSIKRGKVKSEAYWIDLGLENLNSPNFKPATYVFMMANMFKWSRVDKVVDDSPQADERLTKEEQKEFIKNFEDEF